MDRLLEVTPEGIVVAMIGSTRILIKLHQVMPGLPGLSSVRLAILVHPIDTEEDL